MPSESEILAYYAARANEYEKVYAKPERQRDLRDLHKIVPAYLAGRRVLEVACGTGYWTRLIAARAAAVTAVDLSPDMLAVAKTHQPASTPATFVIGDALALDQVSGTFDAAFVGFWWSHIEHKDLHRFLTGPTSTTGRRKPGRGSRQSLRRGQQLAGDEEGRGGEDVSTAAVGERGRI